MSYTSMQLAEVFIQTGELEDALEALNQQLQDEPDDHDARRLRASVLQRFDDRKRLELALNDFENIPSQTVDDLVQQSVIYERLDKMGDAIQVMQKAHQQAPDKERILERLIELMMSQKQYSEVIIIIKKAPQTWRWLMRLADAYSMNNNPENALAALNRAEEHLKVMFPDLLSPVSRNTMAQIHVARGHEHMILNQLKQAEAEFRDAQFHIPNDASITFNLGLIYARSDNLSKATKFCQKALDNSSDLVKQTLIGVIEDDDRYAQLKATLKLS